MTLLCKYQFPRHLIYFLYLFIYSSIPFCTFLYFYIFLIANPNFSTFFHFPGHDVDESFVRKLPLHSSTSNFFAISYLFLSTNKLSSNYPKYLRNPKKCQNIIRVNSISVNLSHIQHTHQNITYKTLFPSHNANNVCSAPPLPP